MAILLNSNKTTPLLPIVAETIEPFRDKAIDLTVKTKQNQKALHAYKDAIDKIYASIHARDEDSIILTSSASEAVSQLFLSVYLQYILTGRKNALIISQRASIAQLKAAHFLESQGCRVHRIPVTIDGTIDLALLKEYVNSKTALVSVPLVDEESGVIQPIEEVAQICQQQGAPLFVDAKDAMGRIPVDMQRQKIDFLSFEGANIGGPKDIGALYIASDAPQIMPLIFGNDSEQGGLRSAIADIASVIGFGKALEIAVDALDFEVEDVRELRDTLEEGLLKIPGSYSLAPWALRVPTIAIMAFEGVHASMLLDALAACDISAYSFATFANANFERPSLVEIANLSNSLTHCTIGFSLLNETTKEDIEQTIKAVGKAVEEIRKTTACKGA